MPTFFSFPGCWVVPRPRGGTCTAGSYLLHAPTGTAGRYPRTNVPPRRRRCSIDTRTCAKEKKRLCNARSGRVAFSAAPPESSQPLSPKRVHHFRGEVSEPSLSTHLPSVCSAHTRNAAKVHPAERFPQFALSSPQLVGCRRRVRHY